MAVNKQAEILVVEDDETNLSLLQEFLDLHHYKVYVAKDGKEAIDSVKTHPNIDCILLDVFLPGMDGLEICHLIKNNPVTENIPIIFLTAADETTEGLYQVINSGMADYIPKPFNNFALLARVKIMVQLKEQMDHLKRERDFNKSLVDQANVIIIVTDEEYKIISYNQQAEMTFNKAIKKAYGKSLLEQFYPDKTYRDGVKSALAIFLETGREKFEIETSFKKPNRQEINIHWSISVIRNHHKHVQSLIHIGKDTSGQIPFLNNMVESLAAELKITNVELDQKNHELQLRNKQLQELNRVKDQFLSVVSHDLRSPLNAILGFADLLLMDAKNTLPEKQLKMIAKIRNSGAFQLNLINDLLDVARSELGKMELHVSTENMNEVVKECVENLESLSTQKSLEVSFHYNRDPMTIQMDRPKMTQVLNNLISNAIKFTPKDGKIDVIASQDSQGITVQIKDSGVGISNGRLQKLFTDYTVTSTKGTEGEKGTGLGLQICKNMVEAHGGTIEVESVEQQGSTFKISLPFQP